MNEKRKVQSIERAGGPRKLVTVDQFCEDNPAFTKGAMRWLLFQRENNGLNRAVVKIGRRVLIDVNEFYRWIDDLQDRSLRDVEG